ncbi:MAG: hypothetical protein MJ223_02610 [Mycoplasmoidaceae bacterium]|nr:hypothetical protein [Mycoplasmoidaceae bacterium]
MKNKKILLPLLSSGALASTIAPTLTSCGTYSLLFAESHNMLNDYINRVLPHSEMEIYGDNAAKNFYLSSVKNNTDIFKDDIMYTFASAFKNEACKTKLETEQLVKYTSYYIDIRNIAVDVEKETIGFSLDAYIKGTGLGNSVYKNFDIVFFNDFKVKFAFALSDASTVALKNDN